MMYVAMSFILINAVTKIPIVECWIIMVVADVHVTTMLSWYHTPTSDENYSSFEDRRPVNQPSTAMHQHKYC